MKRKILSIAITLILMFFLSSCSKNDDNPVAPNQKPQPVKPATPQIQLPQSVSNSNDPHAAQAKGFAAMANSIGQYGSYFTPPASALGKTADDSWDYNWNIDNLIITLHYKKNDNGYSWVVILNGTDDNSVVYSDWKMIEAQQNSDGSSGSMTVYAENSTDPEFEFSWTNDGNGNVTFEYISYGESGGKLNIALNPDNSGSMQHYENVNGQYVMTLKITWSSSGGEWWEYDSKGNEIGHGTF